MCFHFSKDSTKQLVLVCEADSYLTVRKANSKSKYWEQRLGTVRLIQDAIFIINKQYKLLSYSKIGEEQSAEDAEDGPPELLVCFCSGFTQYGSVMLYDCATKTAAVLKSFHLSRCQSMALTL